MSVRVVTGYVRLDAGHRSHDTYVQLCGQLLDAGLPLSIYQQSLQDCWLWQQHAGQGIEPGGKDSAAYHCVQHEKSAWLCREVAAYSPQTVVWVDAGILHLSSVTTQHLVQFVDTIRAYPPDRICVPSCCPVPDIVPRDSVCWAFCGGVLVMPAVDARWFHQQVQARATAWPLTWEVNTWAAVARAHPYRFRLYPADHNEQLFTGY